MGTTLLYDYPYPEPTQFVRQGAAAMRIMAESIEAAQSHLSEWAQIDPADPGLALPAAPSTTADIPLEGTQTQLAGFTLSPTTTLTYTGPLRMFLLSAEIGIEHGAVTPGETFGSDAFVSVAGVFLARSTFNLAGPSLASHMHRITLPLMLTTGQEIKLAAWRTPTCQADVVHAGIRIYPVGPRIGTS